MWHLIVSHPDLAVRPGEVGVDRVKRRRRQPGGPGRADRPAQRRDGRLQRGAHRRRGHRPGAQGRSRRPPARARHRREQLDRRHPRDRPVATRPTRGVRVDLPGPSRAARASPSAPGWPSASGDVILIQDGDLEYSVDDYPALLEPIERGRDVFVLGSRHVRGQPMRHFAESRGTSADRSTRRTGCSRACSTSPTGCGSAIPFTMYKVFRRECIDGARVHERPLRLRLGARRPS